MDIVSSAVQGHERGPRKVRIGQRELILETDDMILSSHQHQGRSGEAPHPLVGICIESIAGRQPVHRVGIGTPHPWQDMVTKQRPCFPCLASCHAGELLAIRRSQAVQECRISLNGLKSGKGSMSRIGVDDRGDQRKADNLTTQLSHDMSREQTTQ